MRSIEIEDGAWNPREPIELPYILGACKSTWRPTETQRPGLYWYHGFGSGHLYLPFGRRVSCTPNEARALCSEEGLKYEERDSFSYHTAVYLGD